MKIHPGEEHIGKKIIIEAGHVYTDEEPTLEHYVGATMGGTLSKLFQYLLGVQTEEWLFVDDYNPKFSEQPNTLDLEEYIKDLNSVGFFPSKTIFESQQIDKAKETIDYLVEQNFAHSHTNGNIILAKNKILLYNSELDKYSCAILDVVLYLQKLEEADACITILPEKFKSQQKKVLTILKKLKTDISKIFPIYLSDPNNQQIKDPFQFIGAMYNILKGTSQLNGHFSMGRDISFGGCKYGF